jgi:transcriptional regulator with XRE-family HTH domain
VTKPTAAALGRVVRARRRDARLTRRRLAARVPGLTESFVANLEREGGNPSFEGMVRVARALEMTLLELVQAAEEESRQEAIRTAAYAPRQDA